MEGIAWIPSAAQEISTASRPCAQTSTSRRPSVPSGHRPDSFLHRQAFGLPLQSRQPLPLSRCLNGEAINAHQGLPMLKPRGWYLTNRKHSFSSRLFPRPNSMPAAELHAGRKSARVSGLAAAARCRVSTGNYRPSSLDDDGDALDTVVSITSDVPLLFERLHITFGVGGAYADYVRAAYRVPETCPCCPSVRRHRFTQPGVGPGGPTVDTDFHARDAQSPGPCLAHKRDGARLDQTGPSQKIGNPRRNHQCAHSHQAHRFSGFILRLRVPVRPCHLVSLERFR